MSLKAKLKERRFYESMKAQADLLVRYQKFRIAGLRLPLARMKNTEFIDDALTILPTMTP